MKLRRGESGRNVQARSQAVTGSLEEHSRIGIERTWRGGGTVWVALLERRNVAVGEDVDGEVGFEGGGE
ncbi:hypothetical protein [Natrialba aegyptia]|uniref:Uncharacterized protein n=1 Tax=Natrialba aegyptia DSM 13077 TaxID=1227491 RepID=M0AS91_9EURY|nr:hypothetical protein [Natrialba aegyptia]ELZ01410.1 hypothetical protein C480_18052 [Natrialba aegyptia DSM 13077]